MNKPISAVMQKHLTTVDIDDTVERVEDILNTYNISCVPVVDLKGNCFGVISTPDLRHFHSLHKSPKMLRAWEVCTHKIIEVGPDISVKEAVELMLKNKIHHIVITENRDIKGILSTLDLLQEYYLKNT